MSHFRLLSPSIRSLPSRLTRPLPRNLPTRHHQNQLTSLSRQSRHTSPNLNPLIHPDHRPLAHTDHPLHRGSHQSSSTVRPPSRIPSMCRRRSRTTNPPSSSTRE